MNRLAKQGYTKEYINRYKDIDITCENLYRLNIDSIISNFCNVTDSIRYIIKRYSKNQIRKQYQFILSDEIKTRRKLAFKESINKDNINYLINCNAKISRSI